MKRLLVIILGSIIVLISACSSEQVGASLPNGYVQITQDIVPDGKLTVVKHIETNCYYTHMDGTYAGAFTQMFIEKDGQSVPYCDRE